MTRWGPIHSCQGGCGAEVQYRGYRLYDAGTDNRHQCARHLEAPPVHRWIECLCGIDVEIIGQTRYERGTIKLHVCRQPTPVATKRRLRVVDKPGPVTP